MSEISYVAAGWTTCRAPAHTFGIEQTARSASAQISVPCFPLEIHMYIGGVLGAILVIALIVYVVRRI